MTKETFNQLPTRTIAICIFSDRDKNIISRKLKSDQGEALYEIIATAMNGIR
jgi:hypothetical protein